MTLDASPATKAAEVEKERAERKFLRIKAGVKQLQEMYLNDPEQSTFNALVCGESGTGKSYMISTMRTPIHVDLFDPGGLKSPVLREMVKDGRLIIANYTKEDPKAPTQYLKWEAEMDARIKEGYFDYMASYVLDSSTTWSDAIMNAILKKAGIPGESPRFTHDYTPQKTLIRNWIKGRILPLPCDVLVTGHLEAQKTLDQNGREVVQYRFMTTGKGDVTIPMLFDELYVTLTKETSRGIEYQLLTQNTGVHVARTRIGSGKWDKFEQPNIKELLKKAGLPCEDKPRLF